MISGRLQGAIYKGYFPRPAKNKEVIDVVKYTYKIMFNVEPDERVYTHLYDPTIYDDEKKLSKIPQTREREIVEGIVEEIFHLHVVVFELQTDHEEKLLMIVWDAPYQFLLYRIFPDEIQAVTLDRECIERWKRWHSEYSFDPDYLF